jgi:16S rRNA (uracil1498-N3)-methyltransferase
MKEKNNNEAPAASRSRRLFADAPLAPGLSYPCTPEQTNRLLNVLRLESGACVHAFNGRDGEWRARLETSRKRNRCSLEIEVRTRPQQQGPDLEYLFAPLKHARLDYMAQKAVELGAAALRPVFTRRTVAARVNVERMRANAVEAAEQCGALWTPRIDEPLPLASALDAWAPSRSLIFCDEAAPRSSPVAALSHVPRGPIAVVVGPEGGFDEEERARLLAQDWVYPISLGPRILRADTAAVASLALVNAILGDWR